MTDRAPLSLNELLELDGQVVARCAVLDARFRAGLPGSTRITLRPLGDVPADLFRAIARAWASCGDRDGSAGGMVEGAER